MIVLYTRKGCACHPLDSKRWLITDFGLSRPVKSGKLAYSHSGHGTIGFRAPEVLKEEYDEDGQFIGGSFTKKSDIFSLGCILYSTARTGSRKAFPNDTIIFHLITGETVSPRLKPTDNPNLEKVVQIQSTATPLWVHLNSILESALATSPEHRSDVQELLAEFQKLQAVVGKAKN